MSNLILAYTDTDKTEIRLLRENESDNHATPFLYLGSCFDDPEPQTTHIINLTKEVQTSKEYIHLILPINDSPETVLDFGTALTFINKCKEEKGCCLVHCMMGISRSVSIVLAFLVDHLQMPLDQAYTYVRSRRKIILPNAGFINQLECFENQRLGRRSKMIEYGVDWLMKILRDATRTTVLKVIQQTGGNREEALERLVDLQQ